MDSTARPPALREPNAVERALFADCLAPLRAICRPVLNDEQVLGYFNALADLPAEAIFFAATEIAGSRVYSSWPMPGEIRAKAVLALAPQLTSGEAWALAQRAARRLVDPNLDFVVKGGKRIGVDEWNRRVLESLPPAVAITLRIFGGRSIHSLRENATIFAQFRDEYERQVTIMRRPVMLPAPARAFIAALAQQCEVKQLAEGNN